MNNGLYYTRKRWFTTFWKAGFGIGQHDQVKKKGGVGATDVIHIPLMPNFAKIWATVWYRPTLIHVRPHNGRLRNMSVWLWSKWPAHWCFVNVSRIKFNKHLTDKNQLENGTEKNHENFYLSQSVSRARFKPGTSQILVSCIPTLVNLVTSVP